MQSTKYRVQNTEYDLTVLCTLYFLLCTCFSLSRHLSHELSLISERAFAGDQFKIFMKTGKIIKAAFITKLFDAHIIFNKQFTSMTYPYLDKELRVCFSCS